MHLVWQFAQAHQLALYWFITNAIYFLPSPLPNERWYGWAFNMLHAIPNVARTISVNRANGNGHADAAGVGK